jgi:integrase/recombinase XerD
MNGSVLLVQYHSRLIALERRAPLTVETYCLEIRRFLEWLEGEGLSAETADTRSLSRYLDFRRIRDGIDSRSTAKAISILRSFFRYMADEKLRPDNPAAILEPSRRGFRLPGVLSRAAMDRLLDHADTGGPLGLRNRALVEFIYSTGLRVSEVARLDISDLNFSEGIVQVRGKGNKERFVLFGREAASRLKRYLEEARPFLAGKRRSMALFIGKTGKRLSRKGIWKNYAALASLAGTSSKLHTLRHTFATELLAGGADLRSVQELLGHANLATTQIYTHVDVSLLRESHRRYMPKLREHAGER